MSAFSDHAPVPVRPRHILLALAVVAAVIAVALFWRQILLAGVGFVALRHLWRRAFGVRPRPRSSWSSLIRSGSIAYAAWNSRWLKPTTHKASVRAKGQPTKEDLDADWM